MVDHGVDGADLAAALGGFTKINEKCGYALGALRHLVRRRGACQQQHQVGMRGAAGPDLLAVDHIAFVGSLRAGLELSGVRTGPWLRDAEGLQAELARGDFRQVLAFLFLVAVTQDRAHGVHLRVTRSATAFGGMDCLQDDAGGAQLKSRAAVFLGYQGGQIARVGEGRDEVIRVAAGSRLILELAPVLAGESRAKFRDRLADLGIVFAESQIRIGYRLAAHWRLRQPATPTGSLWERRRARTCRKDFRREDCA